MPTREIAIADDVIESFFSKTDKNGPILPTMNTPCWVWTAGTTNGYGSIGIKINRKWEIFFAHRVSWVIHNGPIPDDNEFGIVCVLHKCDNRACVNPGHLFLGSRLDNNVDRTLKGKSRNGNKLGEEAHRAKLTNKQVIEIRNLYASGQYSQSKLGKIFNVSSGHISDIVNYQSWKHLIPDKAV